MDKRFQSNNDDLIKIVDPLGREIKGVFRSKTGSIVFKKKPELDRYLGAKNRYEKKQKEVDELREKIDMLTVWMEGLKK